MSFRGGEGETDEQLQSARKTNYLGPRLRSQELRRGFISKRTSYLETLGALRNLDAGGWFPGHHCGRPWEHVLLCTHVSGWSLLHFAFPWAWLSVHPRGTCWSQSHNWPSRQWSCLCTPITAFVSDSSDYVVCPWSALLSAAGSLSFQDHISHVEAAPFKAPELLQGQSDGERPDASQVRCVTSLWHFWACPGERPGPRILDLSWGGIPSSQFSPKEHRTRMDLKNFIPRIFFFLASL